jgi:hypothetical protein
MSADITIFTMTKKVANAILTKESRFEILGLVSITLPGTWWWIAWNMNEPGAVGAIFRCYDDDKNEIAYLLVADVSQDKDERDISMLEESDIPDFDRYLECEVQRLMPLSGRKLIRWMSSHLNHRRHGKALVTAYIAHDDGRDRQYIDIRVRIRQRNVVISGCFDVSRAEQLAKPIFWALSDAMPLMPSCRHADVSQDKEEPDISALQEIGEVPLGVWRADSAGVSFKPQ